MEHNVQSPASDNLKRSEHSETVSELVRRHLNDENHVTTDEELKNVVFDFHLEEPESIFETNLRIDKELTDEQKHWKVPYILKQEFKIVQ